MTIEYRSALNNEMPLIIDLLRRNFDKQLSANVSAQEVMSFYDNIRFEAFAQRQKSNHLYIAKDLDTMKIAGIIEMSEEGEIELFFVDEHYQKKGVGTSLLKMAENFVIKNNLDIRSLIVRSPVLTVNIYKRLGFQITDHTYTNLGVVYVLMEKKVACRV